MAGYDFFVEQVCPRALLDGGIHALHRVRLFLETEEEKDLLEKVLWDRTFEWSEVDLGWGMDAFDKCDIHHTDPELFALDKGRILREMEDGGLLKNTKVTLNEDW